MTAQGQALLHINRQPDTRWMADAACRAHPDWTTDYKPHPRKLLELRQICDQCPVQVECAGYALNEHLHGGVYAGVWLPNRRCPEWRDARDTLHRKTSGPPPSNRHCDERPK
jgi:hypothetical protein